MLNRKLSKYETLQMALSYIEELTRILKSRKKEKSDILKKDDKKDNDNKITD